MRTSILRFTVALTGLTVWFALSSAALAADDFENYILPLRLGGSEVLTLNQVSYNMKVITSDEETVHARPLKENKIYIRGKKLGYCTITVWDNSKKKTIAIIDVTVTLDVTGLKQQIAEHFPNEDVRVYASETGVVLSGTVSGPEVIEQVLRLTGRFLPKDAGKAASSGSSTGQSNMSITNLLKVGNIQQVLLEVKFAEVTRRATRELQAGIGLGKLGNDFSGGFTSSGNATRLFDATGLTGVLPGGTTGTIVGGTEVPGLADAPGSLFVNLGQGGNIFVNIDNFTAMLRFIEEERLGRILAEPKLVTMSGQEASFLAGGEYPFQEFDDNGVAGIEFKEFGVGLRFTPIVNGNGRITLRVAPSVTDISGTIETITGPQATFSTRKLESTVQLYDGQTLALAGLLQDNLSESVSKIPLLGDIPVLGALFRSSDYLSNKTDLLIAVTPHLVTPVNEGDLSFPGEFIKKPNRFEFYLEGRLEGRRHDTDTSYFGTHASPAPPAAMPMSGSGGMEGSFGHETAQ